MDKKTVEQLKFGSNNKEYKVEDIYNSAIYAKKLKAGHLLGFYYLISQKSYSEDESIQKPASAMQHLWKWVSISYKDHCNKITTIFLPINLALSMTKCTTSLNVDGK